MAAAAPPHLPVVTNKRSCATLLPDVTASKRWKADATWHQEIGERTMRDVKTKMVAMKHEPTSVLDLQTRTGSLTSGDDDDSPHSSSVSQTSANFVPDAACLHLLEHEDDEISKREVITGRMRQQTLLKLHGRARGDSNRDSNAAMDEVAPPVTSAGALPLAEDRTVELFERNAWSVVNVFDVTLRAQVTMAGSVEVPEGNGSGFIWDKEGHIVTNYHVIGSSLSRSPPVGEVVARVTLLGADGYQKNFEAKLVGADKSKDLAVLEVDAPVEILRPVNLGQSSKLRVGQRCLAIGNPFGFDHTLTVGVVSGLNRDIYSQTGVVIGGGIQIDAAINPGNSGGVLLDSRGNLIGINTAIFTRTGTSAGVGFAIPVDTVAKLVPQLIQYGKVNDHEDIANWMDCIALPEFEECGRNLEEVLKSDIVFAHHDFGFELTSLDVGDVVDHHNPGSFSCFPSLLSEFLGDPDETLLLPESFHDAQRLQELDESLSSMLSDETRADPGVPTTAELVKLVESQSCDDLGRIKKGNHTRSESWGSTSEDPVTSAQEPEESGLQLVHLLLACAEAIEKADFDTAKRILTQLSRISNPYGDPMQRIALYFGEALSDRLAKLVTPRAHSLTDSKLAYQAFYKVLPFAKFSHVTANQTIYEAVVSSRKVHVVDLDIQQGLQWPCFIQSLAMRPGGAPHLRISAIGTSVAGLQTTKRRLSEFADALKVPFEFTPVVTTLENLALNPGGLLSLRHDEDLAINCNQILHTLAGDELLLSNLLALFRTLNPAIVTLLEVEANHNGASFLARFVESLHYYCALFDSLEGALSRDSPDRFHVENTALAAEIKDIVARKGKSRRARHVRSETWRGWFSKAGFRAVNFSTYTIQQAHMLLDFLTSKNTSSPNSPIGMPYKLSEEATALILGWQDTPVMGVSAWRCC